MARRSDASNTGDSSSSKSKRKSSGRGGTEAIGVPPSAPGGALYRAVPSDTVPRRDRFARGWPSGTPHPPGKVKSSSPLPAGSVLPIIVPVAVTVAEVAPGLHMGVCVDAALAGGEHDPRALDAGSFSVDHLLVLIHTPGHAMRTQGSHRDWIAVPYLYATEILLDLGYRVGDRALARATQALVTPGSFGVPPLAEIQMDQFERTETAAAMTVAVQALPRRINPSYPFNSGSGGAGEGGGADAETTKGPKGPATSVGTDAGDGLRKIGE